MNDDFSPESCKKAKVLIVDDHPVVREGLADLLNAQSDFTVCGEAGSSRKAMAAITETQPDLGVVDITLPGANGIELIKNIVAQWPNLPVLVLSSYDETLYAERALRAGAKGYVMKQEATETLTVALRRIRNGQIYVSPKLANKLMRKAINGNSPHENSPLDILTDRELETLELVGHGHSTRQIADDLGLSIKTIESHRAHLKEKLNLKTGAELVRFAVQWVNAETC